ncbi:hypothetical protein BH11ACT5_BH11ACT5_20870 [soil metagenome]
MAVSTRAFELSTRVPVAPEVAIDFLSDLAAHRGMHPYLVEARVVESGVDDGVTWSDWRIVERPALGPFRYTIRFPARMNRTSPTTMTGDVLAAPGCTLVTSTRAEPDGTGAVVTESTVVTAPALLVGYMAKHARLAHERTYSLLAGELARR